MSGEGFPIFPDDRPPWPEFPDDPPILPVSETSAPELPSDFTYCPDHDAVFLAFMSLLPAGAAWDNVETSLNRGSVIRQFMSGLALSWLHLEDAMCVALDEWFCTTSTIDKDMWWRDYGIPDECDVYNQSVCAKVSAAGPPTADYLIGLLQQNGFEASGRWLAGSDAEFPGVRSTFYVLVDTSLSPAFSEDTLLDFPLGEGARLGSVDLGDLVCMLERYVPAHCAVNVEVAGTFEPSLLGAKLLYWWTAEDTVDGSVTTWTDHINDLDAVSPGGGHPTSAVEDDGYRWVTFDGAAQYLRTASVTVPSSAGSPTQTLALWEQLDQSGDVHVVATRGSDVDFRRLGTRTQTDHQALNVATALTDQLIDANDATLLLGPVVGVGRFEEALIGGRVQGQDTIPPDHSAAAGSSDPTTSTITLGANNEAVPGEWFYGRMRHVMITRGLTPHEIRQLEGWMAWDINRPDILDGSHPFRNFRP